MFWDARIEAVSVRNRSGNKKLIDGYKVRYESWSARFIEWVKPNRVIEPTNENNRLLQSETLEEIHESQGILPPALNMLVAKQYLYARDRARGSLVLPDFLRVGTVDIQSSSSEKIFALAKAGALAVEAALPIGSLDHTDKGPWRSAFASRWRLLVEEATTAMQLMRCVIVLEDTITEEWIKPESAHARACLPNRWKALGEASPSAIAIRIMLLDRSIMYETTDRKRFSCKKKK